MYVGVVESEAVCTGWVWVVQALCKTSWLSQNGAVWLVYICAECNY